MLELNQNDYRMLRAESSRPAKNNQLSGVAILLLVMAFITLVMMLIMGMGELIVVDQPSQINFPIPMPNR